MSASMPNAQEIKWLSELEFARLKQELGTRPSLSTVARVTHSHFQRVDAALIASDEREGCEPACQKHCSHCCHTIVFANLAEIATVHLYLMERLSKAELDAFKKELQALNRRVIEAYNAQEPQAVTCPFLKQG